MSQQSYQIGGKGAIAYDRQNRQWLATSGHVLTRTPAGGDGKQRAIEAALRAVCPALAAAADRLIARYPDVPGLAARVWRGAQIASNGQVTTLVNRAPNVAAVASQSEPGVTYWIHLVTPDPFFQPGVRRLACTCPDWRDGRAPVVRGHRVCKHVAALLLRQQAAQMEATR